MKKLRILLAAVLSVMFAISACMICLHLFQARASDVSDRTAAALAKPEATVPSEETQPLSSLQAISLLSALQTDILCDPAAAELQAIDLAALTAANPDVRGWFIIPGTNISYPLMQGTDNDYYLNNTWDRQASYRGSIFLESRSSADLSDFNTIVYGHNLLDGTMFSQLHKYKNEDFLREYPYIYIVNRDGIHRYRIFAAFEVPTNASAYRLRFSEDQKQAFIDDSLLLSVHDTGIVPTPDDHILTLSTCTGVIRTNRWVVQAILEGRVVTPPEFKQQNSDAHTVLLLD